jgi:hypothetical protein
MKDLKKKLEVLEVLEEVGALKTIDPNNPGTLRQKLGLDNDEFLSNDHMIRFHLEMQTHLLAEILEQVTREGKESYEKAL